MREPQVSQRIMFWAVALAAALYCLAGCGDGVSGPVEPPVVHVGDLDADINLPVPLDVRIIGGPVGLYTYEITRVTETLSETPGGLILNLTVVGTIHANHDLTIDDIDIDIYPHIVTARAARMETLRHSKRVWFRNVDAGSSAEFEVYRRFHTDDRIFDGFGIELTLDVEEHR